MKHLFSTFISIVFALGVHAQCSTVSIQVSSSGMNYVQLYHAGLFNIPNGTENQCHWMITELDGTFVHEANTSGDFADQSFLYFEHNVSTEDSMEVVLTITNEINGTVCNIMDTLYWQETEVLPGSFIYSWAVLNQSGGVEESIQSTNETDSTQPIVSLFPNPASAEVRIVSEKAILNCYFYSIDGKKITIDQNEAQHSNIDVSALPSGIYFCQINFVNSLNSEIIKFIKE